MVDATQQSIRSGRPEERAARIEHLWSPFRVVVIFVAFSLVWIVGTDSLLGMFTTDERAMGALQTTKGLIWIAIVAGTLYLLLSRARGNQRLLHNEISDHHEALETRVRERTEKLLDSREQLRLLTRRLDQLAETERKRISRELHDQMGSDLTGLKIDLQALGQRLPASDAEAAERIGTALALIDSMYVNLRELASQLRPAILDQFGLVAGIEWLAGEFRKRSGCECSTDIETPSLAPDELRDTVLFRICQESLTNVLKHAGAGHVLISLTECDGTLRLLVEDDGCGMPASLGGARDKLGVVGMRERAISIGGQARLEPRPGGGTRIRIEVPCERGRRRGRQA